MAAVSTWHRSPWLAMGTVIMQQVTRRRSGTSSAGSSEMIRGSTWRRARWALRTQPPHILQKTYAEHFVEVTGLFIPVSYHTLTKAGTNGALQRTFGQIPEEVTGPGLHLYLLPHVMACNSNALSCLVAAEALYVDAQRVKAAPRVGTVALSRTTLMPLQVATNARRTSALALASGL